jgi:hypothetical protein
VAVGVGNDFVHQLDIVTHAAQQGIGFSVSGGGRGFLLHLARRDARRPVPPGPLARHQVAELRARIAGGLRVVGYTVVQITQVMRCSIATAERDLRRAGPL